MPRFSSLRHRRCVPDHSDFCGICRVQPIFDLTGVAVAWLGDDDVVYDRVGRARLFLQGPAVAVFNGHQIGLFREGYFYDGMGLPVGRLKRATGGPPVGAMVRVGVPPALQPSRKKPEIILSRTILPLRDWAVWTLFASVP